MKLPVQYLWLLTESLPKMLAEGIRHYGTLEHKGKGNNPDITSWAKEIGGKVSDVYLADEIPWCGLFMAICAKRSGYEVPKDPLWALNWGAFGQKADVPKLSYVLTFIRPGGGHVGMYVGEDNAAYHVLGGNQSDAVTITRIAKSRLYGVRKPKYKIGEPPSVRVINLSASGKLSMNEK